MELFNSLIQDTKTLLEQGSPKVWDYSERDCWHEIGSSELVLQKDAAYEMGASGKGSANYVLFTSSPRLVDKDQVLLYGPDLKDIKGDCDFARIVLLRVGVLDDDDEQVYRILKDIEFAKYHVYPEGYMVRMSPESYREQVRVSKKVLKKGISFKSIGASYIKAYKKDPNVLNATVIFVTAPGYDYAAMKDNAKKANDITNTLTHILEGLPTDCSVCSLKGICDEVEGMKELHFGVGDKGTDKGHKH
jgi:CO dehydrogenase/acetyl-CoA synthase beta subunit